VSEQKAEKAEEGVIQITKTGDRGHIEDERQV
jgi:hypothetical protein